MLEKREKVFSKGHVAKAKEFKVEHSGRIFLWVVAWLKRYLRNTDYESRTRAKAYTPLHG